MPLSSFHPSIAAWFAERLGEPSAPQRDGWPPIRAGENVLIAAPTGSGKTLAAFLHALDGLLRQGDALQDRTTVLYVSPLRALVNDVQKNLTAPLAELRARDASLPEVRVLVRTGDTPAAAREAMKRKPPHILVTTPESLYLLLTSAGGRKILQDVRTVIVDEIHALVASKRGSHLSLSLERLEALCGQLQRIGLSATQKPIERVAQFLVGPSRQCVVVDTGHLRAMDLAIEVPPSPLETVCSHETWDEVYARITALIHEHRTTLVFVNTRKLAERIAARLQEHLGQELVTSHHGSLSRERREQAENRLKGGTLKALVATSSLELGIDVGDVDLVVQVGPTSAIATFLQRAGRAGHGPGRVPKARLFPVTRDELLAAVALLRSVEQRQLDLLEIPEAPVDILAQQLVAECSCREWREDELFALCTRAWPFRLLARAQFDAAVALHTAGRNSLLHRDGVGRRLLGTKRARMVAIGSGGAIPDRADYRVLVEPEGTQVGTVDEDFAVEASAGDVFQLGNHSWQLLKMERGTLRVADAGNHPPSLPFWRGEAPARTRELSAAVAALREAPEVIGSVRGVPDGAVQQTHDYLAAAERALGRLPTQKLLVAERFFDESESMQLVLHSLFGGRINRALGLLLRKRFCRSFGFELQAAATEEAILLSLGPMHSFPLPEVFDYLQPERARDQLIQALLVAPMFKTRWRWNSVRSLLLERSRNGKRVPAPLLRMRADDLMAASWPQMMACAETLPGGDLPVPDHPVVQQTIADCLTEAMDFDGLMALLNGLRDGSIATHCADVSEPSVLAEGVLTARPYAFLDDAPLEERRSQAVLSRRVLDVQSATALGEPSPEAVARVREEAWPHPESAEEVHEALLWMGFVTDAEAAPWQEWLTELRAASRVVREDGRWFAVEATRDPKEVLRGRLQALGPIPFDEGNLELLALEREGAVLRVTLRGLPHACDRRLLLRMHRYTVDRLRAEIEPVSAAGYLRFLLRWQHVAPGSQCEGPEGVATVVRQLAGFAVPAIAWEQSVLPARVRGYKREWLDQLTLSGEVAWLRLWSTGRGALRQTPLCLLPREDLDHWLALAPPAAADDLGHAARALHAELLRRGACFPIELKKATGLLPSALEDGLSELVARGLLTCDSFALLRQLLVAPSRRRFPVLAPGRFSVRGAAAAGTAPDAEWIVRRLLDRWGVLFRAVVAREQLPVPWRDLLRALRLLELRGDVRGGRFVQGFSGEQYAWPAALPLLRQVRKEPDGPPQHVAAGDPLNLRGILTPDERVSPNTRTTVPVA